MTSSSNYLLLWLSHSSYQFFLIEFCFIFCSKVIIVSTQSKTFHICLLPQSIDFKLYHFLNSILSFNLLAFWILFQSYWKKLTDHHEFVVIHQYYLIPFCVKSPMLSLLFLISWICQTIPYIPWIFNQDLSVNLNVYFTNHYANFQVQRV